MAHPTSRKEAERAASEFDPNILEASSVVAAVAVAPDGLVLAANARMRRLLGAARPDRRDFGDLRDYLVDPEASWRAWCDAQRSRQSIELVLRAVDGSLKRVRGDVLIRPDAGASHYVGLFIDAEEQSSLRAAAQHSARMEALGSLTAGVAHDFNNLLTVLVGNLYLVGEQLRDRPRVFEKLKAARDAGKRGTELIKQLMTFARREEVAVSAIDPAKVIGEVLPLLKRALGSRITLETKLQGNVGAVRANAAQLESVVVNLAVNARDAIEGKGRVSIEVTRAEVTEPDARRCGLKTGGSYVAVTVRDTGVGIPTEALSRVFEPFYSTKRDRGGTGLGLSMVRWFAEQVGGTASIDSAVDKGTTVTLLLPREAVDQAAETGERTMPLSTLPTGSERVVVLALDEALRATIHQTLEVLGYRVKVAYGAEDMLTAVAAEATELLLVDGLGRGDVEALSRARALAPSLRIITTADSGQIQEPLGGYCTARLSKPFTLADLAGTVRRALDTP